MKRNKFIQNKVLKKTREEKKQMMGLDFFFCFKYQNICNKK